MRLVYTEVRLRYRVAKIQAGQTESRGRFRVSVDDIFEFEDGPLEEHLVEECVNPFVSTPAHFVPVSPVTFYIFSVLSFGIYESRWIYKNLRSLSSNNEEQYTDLSFRTAGRLFVRKKFIRFTNQVAAKKGFNQTPEWVVYSTYVLQGASLVLYYSFLFLLVSTFGVIPPLYVFWIVFITFTALSFIPSVLLVFSVNAIGHEPIEHSIDLTKILNRHP